MVPAVGRRSDLLGLVLGTASLLVAVVAMVLAYAAWTRPYPADPTQVPTWGAGRDVDRRVLEGPADARAFFDFLEDNAGRKVRVQVDLGEYFAESTGTWIDPDESGFHAPSPDCQDRSLSDLSGFVGGDPACEFVDTLVVQGISEDRPGMFYEHGRWRLSGYFASSGFVGMGMGFHEYAIMPLTTIEAVS
jgi:hypothetical protein